MAKVLYISFDGMTDPLGQSQVLPYLVGLSKLGHRYCLISFEKKIRLRENAETIRKICADANIDWIPLAYHNKPPILSTLYDIFRCYLEAKKLNKKNSFELIHCRSYVSTFVGSILQKVWKIPLIFDMRGFWVDERVEGGIWNIKNPIYLGLYNFLKRKEKQWLSNASHIVSLTQNAKEEILAWKINQVSENKITVIPCCVDTNLFDPSKITQDEVAALKQQLGIDSNAFVLTYLGAIGTWYQLKEMLQFFAVLLVQKPAAIFLFITQEDPHHILDVTKQLNIPVQNIRIQRAKRAEVPLFLSISNFSIFFIRPSFSKKASSPTKQGEIMSMGIQVICNSNVGDTDRIIELYNSGVLVSDYTLESFAKVCNMITSDFNVSQETIRAGAIEYFGLQHGVERYSHIYKNLLTHK